MKTWIPFVLAAVLTGTITVAGTPVDQGAPGKFGPWPVTLSGSSSTDGGSASLNVATTPQLCTSNVHTTTSVGVTAGNTPASQSTRRTITLCNSLQNAGNPLVKCRVDGTNPVMAATNVGDVLSVGDCILYAISSSIVPKCISDTAATNVLAYECN